MPRKEITNLKSNLTNAQIINAVINSSSVLANAVEFATPENIREVASAILKDNAYINEFLDNLINRIGRTYFSSKVWTNPLKKFKDGLLEWGEVSQEIFVNKVKEEFYSMWNAENTLFSIAIPDIRAMYYEMNSRKRYEATINEDMLRQAFLSEGGLSNLVDGIVDRMAQQDEVYEFEVMKNMMGDFATKGKFYPVKVSAVTDEASAKTLIKSIRAMYRKLTFVSNKYNYIGVDTHSLSEDIHLFISADLEAIVDVDVLAKAFNMEKTEFLGHLTILDEIPVTNGLAIMVDRSWFRTYDNKIDTTSAYNAKGLYRNYFFHHWETFAVNSFANAILFTTATPSITSVKFVDESGTEEDEFEMLAGQVLEINTKVVSSGNAKTTLDFSVTSGADYIAELTSTGKKVMVRLKPNVNAGVNVVVVATSQQDSTKTDTATITVVAPTSNKNKEDKKNEK